MEPVADFSKPRAQWTPLEAMLASKFEAAGHPLPPGRIFSRALPPLGRQEWADRKTEAEFPNPYGGSRIPVFLLYDHDSLDWLRPRGFDTELLLYFPGKEHEQMALDKPWRTHHGVPGAIAYAAIIHDPHSRKSLLLELQNDWNQTSLWAPPGTEGNARLWKTVYGSQYQKNWHQFLFSAAVASAIAQNRELYSARPEHHAETWKDRYPAPDPTALGQAYQLTAKQAGKIMGFKVRPVMGISTFYNADRINRLVFPPETARPQAASPRQPSRKPPKAS